MTDHKQPRLLVRRLAGRFATYSLGAMKSVLLAVLCAAGCTDDIKVAPDAFNQNDRCCELLANNCSQGSSFEDCDNSTFLNECRSGTPGACVSYSCPGIATPVEICTGYPPSN